MPVHPAIADTAHATPAAVDLFKSFFRAKSEHDVAATMAHFDEESLVYIDSNLGWVLSSHADLEAVFAEYMPQWGDGLSYPTRIVGDEHSAIVFMTDTPELFGGEIRAIAAVDIRDGKIVRWVDYWDSRHFGSEAAAGLRAQLNQSPQDLAEDTVGDAAAVQLRAAVGELGERLAAGDDEAAASLFATDAVLEDMALRTQICGRLAIGRYLSRALAGLPWGAGVAIRHMLGGDLGGGFEWTGRAGSREVWGATAVCLDANGGIARMTSVWDGDKLSRDAVLDLMALSLDP